MTNFLMRELGIHLLIGSGAIGTVLRRMGDKVDEPVELLNLRRPEAVLVLHKAYREAGSHILVTNTFAANTLIFGDAGLGDLCDEVNRAGVALARQAAGLECLVWASVGPLGLGLRLEDYPDDALADVYRQQVMALAGADALILETFVEAREAQAALAAASETGLPVIFQIGNTGRGAQRWLRIDELLALAHRANVVAVGTNCLHPDDIVPAASYVAAHTTLPVTASANAGHPLIDRGFVTYEYSPRHFADCAKLLAEAGVSVLGGCCGTTPEHIRLVAQTASGQLVLPRVRAAVSVERESAGIEKQDVSENPIRRLMRSERFLVSVEIRAERTKPLDAIVQGAAQVAEAGADLFDVPDNPGATVGRDAMVTAARLQSVLGVPSICHLGVTQSNLMRLHSSLLGAWDLGLRGLLAVTGDAPSMGHLAALAHRVTDVRSSVELLRLIRELREGRIVSGEGVADPPDFCSGVAVARAVPGQIKWLGAKIDAGAEFVYSQPVFTLDDFRKLQDALFGLPIRLFPGLLPLISHRNALSLAGGRIPGISVPDEIVEGFARYDLPDDQRRYGLNEACKLAQAIASEARGLYLIMPFGKHCYADTAQILRRLKGKG